jgi:predicted HicB family RNase H-like nuclease
MKHDINKYSYKVVWSEEDGEYVGLCLEFPSLSALKSTPEAALKEIRFVVDKCVNSLVREKHPIPEPLSLKKFKGNLTLRVSPDIHRKIAQEAAEAGVSINQYILSKLAA